MASKIIGLDMASTGLKTILMDVEMRQVKVQAHAHYQFTTAKEESATEQVSITKTDKELDKAQIQRIQALKQAAITSLPGLEYRAGFDGQQVSSRALSFPMKDLSKIESALQFELEDQIPQSLEDMTSSYIITSKDKTHTELLVGVAYKKDIRDQFECMEQAHIHTRGLIYEPLALAVFTHRYYGAPTLTQAKEQKTPLILIDIGHHKTQVLLLDLNAQVIFARTIKMGSSRIDRTLMDAYQINESMAQQKKETQAAILMHQEDQNHLQTGFQETALPPIEQASVEQKKLSALMGQALRPLIMNLKQTLKPYKNKLTQARCLITGGGSQLKGLCHYLTQEIEYETALLPLPLALQNIPSAHCYTLAYALALSGYLPQKTYGIEFKNKTQQATHPLLQYQQELKKITLCVGIILIISILTAWAHNILVKKSNAQLDASLKSITQKIIGREISDYKSALSIMRPGASLEKAMMPAYSSYALLAMLSESINAPKDQINIKEIDIHPEKIQIKGETKQFESLEQIIENLKKNACFKQINKSSKNTDGSKFEFNLNIEVGCGT